MKRNRIITFAVAFVAAVSLACESETSPTNPGNDGGFGDKRPQNTKKAEEPNPGQQPPKPNADPGPHNDGKHAVFTVTWVGERAGEVEYTIGGAGQKVRTGQPKKDADGKYRGQWTKTVTTISGSRIGFTWYPDTERMFAQCTLHFDGKIQDYQHVQSGPCAVGFKVP